MELLMTLYLILGGFSLLVTFIIIMAVAGKEMVFAFYRRLSKRGCDVFLVDTNKQVRHHFLTPKEGVFKIEGKPYITNPYKITNLTDDMHKHVMQKLDIRRNNFMTAIDRVKEKIAQVKKQLDCLPSKEENLLQIQNLSSFKVELDNKLALLEAKLEEREQSYYLMKRPAYFYIENDPVPKDFFELFTEMDSTQLENVIIRAQTKDPKNLQAMEKNIANLKKLAAIAAIGAIAAAFIAARIMYMVNEIGAVQGISFAI